MLTLGLFIILFSLSFQATGQFIIPQGAPHIREIPLPGFREKAGTLHIDKNGLVYLLNSNELQRFDGEQWKRFQRRKTTDQVVFESLTSFRGEIWVSAEDGTLWRSSSDSLLPVHLAMGNAKSKTKWLLPLQNKLFLAKEADGLWEYDGKQTKQIDAFKNQSIQAIHAQTNTLIVATEEGLFQYHPNQAKTIQLSKEPLISAVFSYQNKVWVGFQSGGIATLVQGQLVPIHLPDDDAVEKIILVKDALWIKDQSGHLWSYHLHAKQTERIHFQTNNKLGRVLDLSHDNSGNVWLSTTNGLMLVHPAWKSYQLPSQVQVQAISKLANGSLVAGTDAGCFVLQEGKDWQAVASNRSNLNILSLEHDANGGLWVGTFGQGLWRLNAKGNLEKPLLQEHAGFNGNIFSIEPADESNTWYLGTLGGIFLLHQQQGRWHVSPFHHDKGPGKFYIFQLLRDKAGVLWIATDGKGIYQYQKGVFKQWENKQDGAMRIVSSLATDENGTIWASSPEGQIGNLAPNGWKTQYVPFNDAINIIQPTHSGNVLLGSQNGLWLYQPEDSLILQLDKMYGLPRLSYNTNAIYTHGDEVFLGANSSIVSGRLSWFEHPQLPEILLDKPTTLDGKPIPLNAPLDANKNNLRFQFQVPWYYQADMLFTRYKLHGLHTTWVETEKRDIFLQGLEPGQYELEIQVAFDPNFSKVSVAKQPFKIAKPFYATWWFVVLVGLGLVLGIRQLVHWREKKRIIQNQAEKERIRAQYEILKSQISPHFLFNAFNTLSQLIEVDTEKAGKYVNQLALVFRKVLHFRDQDLITLAEEMSLVEAYIHLQQQRFEDRLHVQVEIPNETLQWMVVPMSVQLLIENAVKHNVITAAKPLEISLKVYNMQLTVKNKIQLKKQPEPSTGFGLSSLQSRYKQDFGQTLQIDDSNGFFTVTLPLINTNP